MTMAAFIFFGIFATLFVVVLGILIGMVIQSSGSDWLSDGWLLISGFIVALFIMISSFIRVGNMRIKSAIPPQVETRITTKIVDGEVQTDTVYVYRFEK